MMKKIYGDDCLSCSRFHEWFKRFQEDGRLWKTINIRAGQVMLWTKKRGKEPKSSLKYMESELGISASSIYRIFTENLEYIKVCAKFVPHTLKPHKKGLRIQHSRDVIKEAKKNRNCTLRLLLVRKTSFDNERKTLCWRRCYSKGFDRYTQRHTEGWTKKVIR